MSSALLVPETHELTGDDAWALLRRTGWWPLIKDSYRRLRVADGFSHARSLAFVIALVAIQGLIALVGLASVLHKGGASEIILAAVRRAVPGPAGHVLTAAVVHAHQVAGAHQYLALFLGTVGSLITGTTAMGQLERGLNRIYGIEQDRPTLEKYGIAFVFALSVGTLIAAAFVSIAFGRDFFHSARGGFMASAWLVVRWPFGLLLLAIAVTVLLRWSPRRRQPGFSWLAFGAGVAVILWGLATAALEFFYTTSSSFGTTYGPLAGVVALLFWCLLSSIAVYFGAALAAQLEAVRAGEPGPQDVHKVTEANRASA